MIRAYLAGPDVFLPEAVAVGTRKVEICRKHGIAASYPLDPALDLTGLAPSEAAARIFHANTALMRGADVILANLTPFRGPSADAGTVYEVGFMAGMGRPVFGYGNESRDFATRTRMGLGCAPRAGRDEHGIAIEDFGLADNLMIPGGATLNGGGLWMIANDSDGLAAFSAFEAAVKAVTIWTRTRETLDFGHQPRP